MKQLEYAESLIYRQDSFGRTLPVSASIQVLIDHHLERIDEAVEPVNSFRLAIQKSKKDQ